MNGALTEFHKEVKYKKPGPRVERKIEELLDETICTQVDDKVYYPLCL